MRHRMACSFPGPGAMETPATGRTATGTPQSRSRRWRSSVRRARFGPVRPDARAAHRRHDPVERSRLGSALEAAVAEHPHAAVPRSRQGPTRLALRSSLSHRCWPPRCRRSGARCRMALSHRTAARRKSSRSARVASNLNVTERAALTSRPGTHYAPLMGSPTAPASAVALAGRGLSPRFELERSGFGGVHNRVAPPQQRVR